MIGNYHIMHFGEEDQPNITGDAFKAWMDYCFSTCDIFSLTRVRCGTVWTGPKDHDLMEWEIQKEKRTGQRSKYSRALDSHPAQAAFLKKLEPWRVGTIRSCEWYGIKIPSYAEPMEIDLFKTCAESKRILLAHYDNFLLERPRVKHPAHPDLRVRDLPEDLCFFRGDDLWMGSCSHEGFAHITKRTAEDEVVMRQLDIYDPVPWENDRRDFRMKLSDFIVEK